MNLGLILYVLLVPRDNSVQGSCFLAIIGMAALAKLYADLGFSRYYIF